MEDIELLLERLELLAIVLDALMPRSANLVRNAITLLKEQENASKRNPVIVCPHCGKRVK